MGFFGLKCFYKKQASPAGHFASRGYCRDCFEPRSEARREVFELLPESYPQNPPSFETSRDVLRPLSTQRLENSIGRGRNWAIRRS